LNISILTMSAPSIVEQGLTSIEALPVTQVQNYATDFMNQHDGSHDYAHVERVLGLALGIIAASLRLYDF
jgi:HD superfamily phosphodiesterase